MLPLPFAKINDHVFTKAPLPIYYGPAGNGASGLSSLRIVHLGDGGVAGSFGGRSSSTAAPWSQCAAPAPAKSG